MRNYFIYIGLIVVGLGILGLIFALVGVEEILHNLELVGWRGFLAYLALCLMVIVFTVIGWHIVLRSHGIKPSIRHTGIAQFMAYSISFITPSMYLGGEPLKSYYIGKLCHTSKSKIFSTAIFAKFQELAALLLFIYLGTIAMVLQSEKLSLPPGVWITLLVCDVILGLFFYSVVRSIFGNYQFVTRLVRWIGSKGLWKKRIEKIIPKLARTEELIHQAFKHDWRAALLAFFFNLCSITTAFLKPLVFFWFLTGGDVFTLSQLAVIFTLSQFLQSLQVTPGCIGIFEGGQIGIFALIGVELHQAASFLAVIRLIDFLIVGGGIYLAAHYSLVRITKGKISTTPEVSEPVPASSADESPIPAENCELPK